VESRGEIEAPRALKAARRRIAGPARSSLSLCLGSRCQCSALASAEETPLPSNYPFAALGLQLGTASAGQKGSLTSDRALSEHHHRGTVIEVGWPAPTSDPAGERQAIKDALAGRPDRLGIAALDQPVCIDKRFPAGPACFMTPSANKMNSSGFEHHLLAAIVPAFELQAGHQPRPGK